jgi:hypothetical protein
LETFVVAGTSEEFADPVGSNALPVLRRGLTTPFASDVTVSVAGVLGVVIVVPPAATVTVPLPSGLEALVEPAPLPPLPDEPVVPFPEPPDPEEPDEPDDPCDPLLAGVAAAPTPPLPAPRLIPPSLLQAERRSAQLAAPQRRSFRMYISTARTPSWNQHAK